MKTLNLSSRPKAAPSAAPDPANPNPAPAPDPANPTPDPVNVPNPAPDPVPTPVPTPADPANPMPAAPSAAPDPANPDPANPDPANPDPANPDPAAAPVVTAEEQAKLDALIAEQKAEWLKGLGFTSEDEINILKEKVNNIPETPEQIAEREAANARELLAFAISNNHISAADVNAIETLKASTSDELAYNAFKTKFIEGNKGRFLEDGVTPFPVTEQEIKDEFNNFYHINSDSKFLQDRGREMIEDVAASIKSGPEQKLEIARQKFENHKHLTVNLPAYQNFIKQNVSEVLATDTLVVKNGDSPFNFKLKDSSGKALYDANEIEGLFVNDQLYHEFLNKDKKALGQYVKDKVNEHLYSKNVEIINAELRDFNVDAGKRLGSTTGAAAPFSQAQNPTPVPVNDGQTMTPEQESRLRNRYAKVGARA